MKTSFIPAGRVHSVGCDKQAAVLTRIPSGRRLFYCPGRGLAGDFTENTPGWKIAPHPPATPSSPGVQPNKKYVIAASTFHPATHWPFASFITIVLKSLLD